LDHSVSPWRSNTSRWLARLFSKPMFTDCA
jgi:hypothetical protein